MSAPRQSATGTLPEGTLPKAPSGIQGLDEITGGGLPRGRPTLVCGGAGCGKTLFGIEFLVRGLRDHGEPGVFMAFEETAEELTANVRSLGFDLEEMIAGGKLAVDYVRIERSEIEETGEYDLEGLFVRLGHAIDSLGAKRVVLDTLETLFGGLSNAAILRAELRRLFRWLKDRGVTAVITAERGLEGLTRHGLEEYVSDCVIVLDHRVSDQLSTRRLRVLKYRGTAHGTNEYPFLIDRDGLRVLPITSLGLAHEAPTERVSTGIPELDGMFGGRGYYRGASVMVCGSAGTGKTSLGGHFAVAACARGERSLYFAFEESPSQLCRNLRSIGLDLERWRRQDLLRIDAARPTLYGLEMHLAQMLREIERFDPQVAIIDPVSSFLGSGSPTEAKAMLVRVIDFLKARQVTVLLLCLTEGDSLTADIGISSLIDTWIALRDSEHGGERRRGLHILKSRGMAHSNRTRELRFTDHGLQLVGGAESDPSQRGGDPP